MFKYESVLLEKADLSLRPRKSSLPVFVEFDVNQKVGTCSNFEVRNGGLFGTIESSIELINLYPSIGYVVLEQSQDGEIVDGIIHQIGVCGRKNIDESIPPISNGIQYTQEKVIYF